MKDVIMFYKAPNFIMLSGTEIPKNVVKGSPRIGVTLESHVEKGWLWKVCDNNADGDCVGNVCPLR